MIKEVDSTLFINEYLPQIPQELLVVCNRRTSCHWALPDTRGLRRWIFRCV